MGGLGGLARRTNPFVAIPQARNTSAIRGVLRVGAGNRAGRVGSGGGTFSSGTTLASPAVRASFVPRDGRHSKGFDGISARISAGPARLPESLRINRDSADNRLGYRGSALFERPAGKGFDSQRKWQSMPPVAACTLTRKRDLSNPHRCLRSQVSACV